MAFVFRASCCARARAQQHSTRSKCEHGATPLVATVAPRAAWKCVKLCGACCKLDDYDASVLTQLLHNERDVQQYVSMIAPDGWCKWFDTVSRTCTIYETRPRFCRVSPQLFHEYYAVPEQHFHEFAISCCRHHIHNTFGEQSAEASRFDRTFTQSTSPQTPPHEA